MNWFDSIKAPKIKASKVKEGGNEKPSEKVLKVPEGLWVKCSSCGEILQSKILKDHLHVCPECNYHFRIGAWERILQLSQDDSFEEFDKNLKTSDPLQFVDTKPYSKRLEVSFQATQQFDAIVTGQTSIQGVRLLLASFEFRFMGGSMGIIVGEKLSRLFEKALSEKLPVVVVSASGGARMQEGIFSLMQMAKTVALVREMKQCQLPYISVLTDPTTGGVAASFAMLGDIILSEPGALVGFAGPRVIEQTMRQALPPGFQRAEFLLKHGFIDLIVQRSELPQMIAKLIDLLKDGSWQKSSRVKQHPI
jgi:acetyl-CoA carboxylase carboxyl transferase subunit beta